MAGKARKVKALSSKAIRTKNSTLAVKKPMIKTEVKLSAVSDDDCSPEEIWHRFEVELKWCVEQLESQLSSKKLNQRQLEDTNKALKVLINPTAPLIKKRQLMRASFGDYRQTMKEEEMKFKKDMKKMNVSMVEATKQKGTFLRKCAVVQNQANKCSLEQVESRLSAGDADRLSFSIKKSDNSFKFDFSPPDSEAIDEKV